MRSHYLGTLHGDCQNRISLKEHRLIDLLGNNWPETLAPDQTEPSGRHGPDNSDELSTSESLRSLDEKCQLASNFLGFACLLFLPLGAGPYLHDADILRIGRYYAWNNSGFDRDETTDVIVVFPVQVFFRDASAPRDPNLAVPSREQLVTNGEAKFKFFPGLAYHTYTATIPR